MDICIKPYTYIKFIVFTKQNKLKAIKNIYNFPFVFTKIKITSELDPSFNDVNDFVIGVLTADFTFGDISLDIRLVFSLLGVR